MSKKYIEVEALRDFADQKEKHAAMLTIAGGNTNYCNGLIRVCDDLRNAINELAQPDPLDKVRELRERVDEYFGNSETFVYAKMDILKMIDDLLSGKEQN